MLANRTGLTQDAQMPRFVEDMDTIEAIDDAMRELVEMHWPWQLSKLPPQTKQ